jgi:hypothetical protein
MEVARGYEPKIAVPTKESIGSAPSTQNDEFEIPTEEELATLRRVSGQIPWTAYTVAFVELCERFSYYGTTAVCEYPRSKIEKLELTVGSCQLHSATPSRRFNDGCGVLGSIWCSGYGTACIDWPDYFVSPLTFLFHPLLTQVAMRSGRILCLYSVPIWQTSTGAVSEQSKSPSQSPSSVTSS